MDGGAGVAVDSLGGKVYWTDSASSHVAPGRIRRANLDGSQREDLVSVGLRLPTGIAIDTKHAKIYWTETFHDKIMRANLDGSEVQDIVIGIDAAHSIAVDMLGEKIYWPEAATGKIQRANLDGSAVEDVIVGLDDPVTMALDISGGKMYWTNSGGQQPNHIARANLDGTNIETIISGVGGPWGIAIAPDPVALPGDYNRNGTVDAADYVVWRNTRGQSRSLPNESGLNIHSVDIEDYWFWQANFGRTIPTSDALSDRAVPEPSLTASIMIGMTLATLLRLRDRPLTPETVC
jgi:DNA-binding beta-propeller fold protein YncE